MKDDAEVLFSDINTYEVGYYTLVVRTTDQSGNVSKPFTLLIEVSRTQLRLGVEEMDLADMLTVAPNPTTGQFAITIDLAQNEDITVDVFNNVGQKVAEVVNANLSNGTYSVDLSGNANGIYYVKMQVKDAVITKKVMLNQ